MKKAYSFNNPLILRENVGGGKYLPSEFSMVSTDCKNIIIDTIKQAEDNEDIIVRAYDAHNMQSKAKFNFGFDVKKAFVCDMLENNISEIAVDNNSLEVMIKNFEVVTLRLCR